MNNTMTNKKFLITGATTGIGNAVVAQLSENGGFVVGTGRDPARIQEAKSNLSSNRVEIVASDASNLDAITGLGRHLRDKWGEPCLDGVVINAGIAPFLPIETVTADTYDTLFGINVRGPVFLAKTLSPLLKDGASVVFTSSVIHHVGTAGGSIYSASKGALTALMKSLALEWAPRGIRVNSIAPGVIETQIQHKMGLSDEQRQGMLTSVSQRIPLQRAGDACEVARVLEFLLSSHSSYVTGAEIVIDGGWHLNVS